MYTALEMPVLLAQPAAMLDYLRTTPKLVPRSVPQRPGIPREMLREESKVVADKEKASRKSLPRAPQLGGDNSQESGMIHAKWWHRPSRWIKPSRMWERFRGKGYGRGQCCFRIYHEQVQEAR